MIKPEIDFEMMAFVRCVDCGGGGFGIDDRLIPFPCGSCSPKTGYGNGKVLFPVSLLKIASAQKVAA